MRIALITDTHFGVRGDNIIFLQNTQKFLKNIFFPYLDKHNIKTVIHLGDLVDKRKITNTQTANILREDYIEPLMNRNIDYHHILGNHDSFFKNTLNVNTVNELYGTYGFPIYKTATEVMFDNTKILFVPWICKDNSEYTYEKIKTTDAQICLGHLQIQGFEMFKGVVATHGDDSSIYNDRFDLVCSGHFHRKSSISSINYLGSHAQFTWADYDDQRGFHILDTETRELTFIENPYKMFVKTFYDDSKKTVENILETDFSIFSGVMCKIIVLKKTNPYWFDLFYDEIEKAGAIDIQIVEDKFDLNIEESNENIETVDNIEFFKEHIRSIEGNVNKSKLEELIISLYIEATKI